MHRLPAFLRRTPPAPETPLTPPAGATVAPPTPNQADTYRHLITRTDPSDDRGLWAYYVLPGVDQQFVGDDEKDRVRDAQMYRWADLIGRRIWLRGTLNPFPITPFGARLTRTPGRPVPDGTRTWGDLVESAQNTLLAYDARSPLTVLGVHITADPPTADDLPLLASDEPLPDNKTHLASVRRELAAVTAIVAGDGFNAAPVTSGGLRWLIHASAALGCPVPPLVTDPSRETDQTWRDTEGFTGDVLATAGVFTPTVNVRTMRDLTMVERHVLVQPAARFDPRDPAKQVTPWLAWTVTLDDPDIGAVDYVVTGQIIAGEDLVSSAEFTRRLAESQADNWADVGETAPPAVLRGIARASEYEDEVANGSREIAARFRGVALYAVAGDSEGEALDRATRLRSQMMRAQRIQLADTVRAQYAMYRAFTPGAPETADPAVTKGHVTQMPLYYLSTAVPNGYATVGDQLGMPLGPVAGATDVYVHDPHAAPRRNISGLTAFLGEQGSGKSTLAAGLIDWSVAQGVPNVVADPGGQLRRLCNTPWNRADSYVYDFTRAAEGVAVPSLLVPNPVRSQYTSDDDYQAAVGDATVARRDVTIDVFRELMPYQVVMSDRGAEMMVAIEDVVTEYGSEYGADPWLLVEQLKLAGEFGADAARLLRVRGKGTVFFPPVGRGVDDSELRGHMGKALLTVVSLEGMAVPSPNVPRPMWTREQQRSAPLLHVASHLAMRTMYNGRGTKVITMDEAGIIAPQGQGASPVLMRAATESRKFGATVQVIGQNPSMLTSLGDDVTNLVGGAFIGRLDRGTAASCLPLLGLPVDSGHDQTIASLAQGEFVVRRKTRSTDQEQTVRRIYVDRGNWHPDLLAALDTTPEGSSDEWADNPWTA